MNDIKKEIVKFNRKVLEEIFRFRAMNPGNAGNLNKFFMSFETDEAQERMAELMAEFVRLRMNNNKNVQYLPPGEVGFLFKQYVNAFF